MSKIFSHTQYWLYKHWRGHGDSLVHNLNQDSANGGSLSLGLLSLLGLHSRPIEAFNLIITGLLSALSLVLAVQSPGGDNAIYTAGSCTDYSGIKKRNNSDLTQ